jgi:hypothetical protein
VTSRAVSSQIFSPRRRRRRRVLLTAGLFVLLTGFSGALSAAAGFHPNGDGVKVLTFAYRSHAGRERKAYLVLPAWYDERTHPAIPLVISPHGRGVDGAYNLRFWGGLPARGSFAVISPDGQGRGGCRSTPGDTQGRSTTWRGRRHRHGRPLSRLLRHPGEHALPALVRTEIDGTPRSCRTPTERAARSTRCRRSPAAASRFSSGGVS